MIEKGIKLSVRYVSDLKGAQEDLKKFRELHSSSSKAITIPVKIDLSSIKAQSKEAENIIRSSINAAVSTKTTAKGDKNSLINTSGSTRQLEDFAQTADGLLKSTVTTFEGTSKKIDTILQQTGRGITELKTITTGTNEDSIVTKKSIDNLRQFKDQINEVNKSSGKKIAKAEGLGDSNKQMQALIGKANAYQEALEGARRSNLQNSKEFIAAERSLDRINERFTRLASSNTSGKIRKDLAAASKEFENPLAIAKGGSDIGKEIDTLNAKAERYRKLISRAGQNGLVNTKDFKAAEQALAKITNRLTTLNSRSGRQDQTRIADKLLARYQNQLKAKIDINKAELATAKAETNKTIRAQKVNRVYAEREQLIKKANRALSRLETSSLRRGRQDIADRASTQINGNSRAFSQNQLDQKRFNVDQNKGKVEARLRRRIQFNERFLKQQLASLALEERRAQKLTNANEKENKTNAILKRRVALYGRIANRLNKIEATARTSGLSKVGDSAAGSRSRVKVGAINSMEKLSKATLESKRNLDFHGSSLIKNAGSIVKWMAPLAIIQGTLQAFNAGVQGVISTERQFATLQAVYRGTATEARQLRDETLSLAVAQGRSTDEALDAAIRFARLGLTRQQTAKLTETALIAANVAEIAAGDAAEKLSSIYASYNLTVTETVLVLDKLNAISNTYNTTNKDLLEGISRAGGTARQAGLDIAELAGVIGALTGATGRSGSEAGNALNFIITRIRKAKNIQNLQETFDIDLTETNGEIKEFDQVLRILSTRYNALTGSQKDLLVEMAAGARQANRFRLTLENYSQAQILTARANLDSNSALKENDKIINTLDAALNRIQASWTELFVTLADSGALDAVTGLINYLSDSVNTASEEFRNLLQVYQDFKGENSEQSKEIKITNTTARRSLNSSTATEKEIDAKISKLQSLLSRTDQQRKRSRLSRAASLIGRVAGVSKIPGSTDGSKSKEALKKEIDALYDAKTKAGLDALSESLEKVTTQIAQSRDKVTGLQQGSDVFANLAKDIESGTVAQDKLNKTFIEASGLLFLVDGGIETYANNFGKFLKLSNQGDTSGTKQIAEELSALFATQSKLTKQKFLNNQTVEAQKLQGTISTLNQKLIDIPSKFKGIEPGSKKFQDLNFELNKTKEELANNISALTTIQRSLTKIDSSSLSAIQKINLKEYFDDVTKSSEALSESISNQKISGEDDPLRDRQRKIASLEQESKLLEDILAKTKAQSEVKLEKKSNFTSAAVEGYNRLIRKAQVTQKHLGQIFKEIHMETTIKPILEPGSSDNDKAKARASVISQLETVRDSFVAQYDTEEQKQRDIISLTELQITQQKKLHDEKRKAIELETRATILQQQFQAGASQASNSAHQFSVGSNTTEQQINQSNALINRSQPLLKELQLSNDINSTSLLRGRFLQDEATIKANINALDIRSYSILAQRTNDETKLSEELERQAEARSKSLSLASREDQLRAAATAGAIANRGSALTRDEFSFLSQPTRQNINSYNPDATAGLNDTKKDFIKSRAKLDSEANKIATSLGTLRENLDNLSTKYTETIQALDPKQLGLDLQPAQDAANDPKPVIDLDFQTNINLDISEGLASLADTLTDRFNTRLSSEMNNLRVELGAGNNLTTPATNLQ